eukprot:Hpha_TRINITY_DN18572_c0_g1::TRINITY_DN18572_c0_g1_i1::g.195233::m.195233
MLLYVAIIAGVVLLGIGFLLFFRLRSSAEAETLRLANLCIEDKRDQDAAVRHQQQLEEQRKARAEARQAQKAVPSSPPVQIRMPSLQPPSEMPRQSTRSAFENDMHYPSTISPIMQPQMYPDANLSSPRSPINTSAFSSQPVGTPRLLSPGSAALLPVPSGRSRGAHSQRRGSRDMPQFHTGGLPGEDSEFQMLGASTGMGASTSSFVRSPHSPGRQGRGQPIEAPRRRQRPATRCLGEPHGADSSYFDGCHDVDTSGYELGSLRPSFDAGRPIRTLGAPMPANESADTLTVPNISGHHRGSSATISTNHI